MIPGSGALDLEIERLIARCRPYVDVTGAIYRIRDLQHRASTGRTSTHGDPQVFDLEAFRTRHEAGCYQDDDGPEAA